MQRSTFLSSFVFMSFLTSYAAAAVLAPNMSACNIPVLPLGESVFNCCAPAPTDNNLPLFTPNLSSTAPLRLRRPAHLVDDAYAEKVARAYALMKALPASDPRSFVQQANIHCAYCDDGYDQMNSSLPFRVHGSWLFFPFHRWYLFFHERILGKLLGEDDFAIPFWNYDHPDGVAVPPLYSTFNDTLVDTLRDIHHDARAPAALDYAWDSDTRSVERQVHENANAMYRALIRDATSKHAFFGAPYRAGQEFTSDVTTGFGTVEIRPHNSMHLWLGLKTALGWKDMGSFYSAGRDPLFYSHHAAIDRLWEVWKAMPNNYDLEDEDYLDAEFAFYNEDAELVRVKIRDALNISALGYAYEEVENKWMEAEPVRRSEGEAELREDDIICVEGERITGPCSIVMEREVGGVKEGEYMEFVVEYGVNDANHLDIYINLPNASVETDSGCEEYFEFFLILPRFLLMGGPMDGGGNATATFWTSDITGRLNALELIDAPTLVVTLVPRPLNASTAHLALLQASIGILGNHISTS